MKNPMLNRRTFLKYAAMGAGSALLAACAAPAAAPGAAPAAPAAPAVAVADKGKLEIFSWWTAGGEVEGLNNMFEIFKRDNPGVEVINAAVAAQGAGQGGEMKALLETRMLGGDPPESFQVHLGHELIDSHVIAGRMEPLDDLYAQEGWADVFPPDLMNVILYDGHPWSVPVNIHRSNLMWYRPGKLDAIGAQARVRIDVVNRVVDDTSANNSDLHWRVLEIMEVVVTDGQIAALTDI